MPAYHQLTAIEKELLELEADVEAEESDGYPEHKSPQAPVNWRTYYQLGEPVRAQEWW